MISFQDYINSSNNQLNESVSDDSKDKVTKIISEFVNKHKPQYINIELDGNKVLVEPTSNSKYKFSHNSFSINCDSVIQGNDIVLSVKACSFPKQNDLDDYIGLLTEFKNIKDDLQKMLKQVGNIK